MQPDEQGSVRRWGDTHEGTSQPRGPQLQAKDAMKMQMKTMTRMAMWCGSLSDALALSP